MPALIVKIEASIAARRARRAEQIHAQFEQSRRRKTRPLPPYFRFA